MAPAGSQSSFLAALAAGADAVYCGLKHYSARMAAKNFTLPQLASLAALARKKGTRVYVALNSLLTSADLVPVSENLARLVETVRPDALIVQDLAVPELAAQVGYKGEIHLSTLANVSFAGALETVARQGFSRVVIPRELNIDEIKAMAAATPRGLGLEAFVHGALCYSVSGRCYWSSFLGGKSGLRGRCVQPCRRQYTRGKQRQRSFACQDLSLDVLVKVLRPLAPIRAWKIEGRKKGAHYTYYTTRAYQMLRDRGGDPQAKKDALNLLAYALGRPAGHYQFLPQRPQHPIQPTKPSGSGMFVGKVRGPRNNPYTIVGPALIAGDVLRVGYEDEPWHARISVGRAVPARGRLHLKLPKGKSPPPGTPVFLTNRSEPALAKMIADLENELADVRKPPASGATVTIQAARNKKPARLPAQREMSVFRPSGLSRGLQAGHGVWLSPERPWKGSPKLAGRIWFWLPPVLWPSSEAALGAQIAALRKAGGRRFVLNAPWQVAFFPKKSRLHLWAGPFCNLANDAAIAAVAAMGIRGVIVSPELGRNDFLALPRQAPLPLGAVVSGLWPLGISRIAGADIAPNQPFASPRGEQAWMAHHGDLYWLYPNWSMDLEPHRQALLKAGYRLLVNLVEPIPPKVRIKKRPGLWNWNLGLQ